MSGTLDILPVSLFIELLCPNIKLIPHGAVITFFERVQLIVICATLSIYFRLRIRLQNALHLPFAVDETTISKMQIWCWLSSLLSRFTAYFFTNWAFEFWDLRFNRDYTVAAVDDDHLFEGLAIRIEAVCYPTKAVSDFSVPWSLIFPVHFHDIFDGVEREVYS